MAPCPAQPGKVAVVRAGQSWLHPCILAGDSLKGSGVTVTFGGIDLGPSWGSAELLPLPGHQVPARPRQQQPLCHLPELSKALWLHWENGNAWILRAWGPRLCPCCLSTFQPLLPMCSCDIAVPNPLLSCPVPHLSAHGDLWDICSLPWTPQPPQGSLCPAKSGAADDATRLPALEPGPGTRGGLSELRELPRDGAFPPSGQTPQLWHGFGMPLELLLVTQSWAGPAPRGEGTAGSAPTPAPPGAPPAQTPLLGIQRCRVWCWGAQGVPKQGVLPAGWNGGREN